MGVFSRIAVRTGGVQLPTAESMSAAAVTVREDGQTAPAAVRATTGWLP